MHIPDGFLDFKTATAAGVLAVAAATVSMRSVGKSHPRTIPLMGITGAFIFAAQMVNFPVGPGTSGHLMGGALAAVLLGPAEAVVTMTAVLVVQCFLFADGGVTALGANMLNIAVAAPVLGGWIAMAPGRISDRASVRLAAAMFGGWFSTVAAAALCAGELAWSGTVPWSLAFPAMVNVHMVIGLGEAAITGVVLAAILRLRPELARPSARAVPPEDPAWGTTLRSATLAAVVLTAVILFVAPFASPLPDGLERVASALGFDSLAAGVHPSAEILKDYTVPGMSSAAASTLIAGAIGTVAVFGLSVFLGKVLSRNLGAR
jgi:cobalt/nickel transport system permease protein